MPEETSTRQLGVPFMRLSVAEASEQELADWLKVIETNPENAGKSQAAKSGAASSTANATP
jgi:hypothetical protein